MNTFDSQHSSLDYDQDLLGSNPFADTPSHSTHDLNISSSSDTTTLPTRQELEAPPFEIVHNEPPQVQQEQQEEEQEEQETYRHEKEQEEEQVNQQFQELNLIQETVQQEQQYTVEPEVVSFVETDTQVKYT